MIESPENAAESIVHGCLEQLVVKDKSNDFILEYKQILVYLLVIKHRTMSETLKEKTARGLFWGTLNSGTTQILNLIIGVFLARILSPGDYGIVGMLAIFTAIAGNLQSSGFSNALINIKEPTHGDYNAVFWFNILTSISIYVILFFCAPLIAWFFHVPALTNLSRFIFLTFVMSSFGIVPNVIMTKDLMIKELTISSNVALVLSGITGITMALMGMTYWSLAWQQLIYITVMNIYRYYYCYWRPTWKVNFAPIKKMFGFSVKILITMILNTINNNILTFVFGRLFTTKAVGNFSQAYKWNQMAYSLVGNTLQQVAQPVLSSLTDDSRDREKRVFRKMMRFTAMLAFPCLFGLALISKEFILTLLGVKWIDSVLLMQILCLGGAFMPMYSLFQNLAISHQRSDTYMWCNFFQIIIQIGVILLCYKQGIVFMVVAFSVFNVLWLGAWFLATRRLIQLSLSEILSDTLPFMLLSALVMLGAFMVSMPFHSVALVLIIKILVAIILYIAVMRIFYSSIFDEVLDFFLKRKA